jgi:hypothetical protein
MADEDTVKADSDSAKPDGKVDSSTTIDVNAKSSDADVPWHKDSRFKDDLEALKIGKSIKSVLEANDLTDLEDLKDLVESGKKIHGRKLDLDNLDEIMEDSKTLKKYQAYWKQQEVLNKQSGEAPEETIARLKKERDEVVNKFTAREMSEREAKEAKQSVAFYEGEVKSLLEGAEVSKTEKEFLAWSLGVGNECNEIQITDKRAIRKVLNDGVKKYNTLVEEIKNQAIKDYIAGKKGIPNVASTDGTVATSKQEAPRTLKGMRNSFQEIMKGGSK